MHRNQRMGVWLLALFALAQAAGAADVFWLSAVSGNWSDGTKWSTGSPPGGSDRAILDQPGSYVVTLTASVTVNSLTMSAGTIELAGNQLQVAGGTLQYDGGAITGPGTLLIGDNTVFNGAEPYTNTATLDFYNNNVVNVDIVNEGTITRNRVPAGTVTFNGTVENAVGALFNARSSNPTTIFILNNGLTNHGTLSMVNGPVRVDVNNGPLVNHGTINGSGDQLKTLRAELHNMAGGVLDVPIQFIVNKSDAQHLNEGTINLTSDNLFVAQGGTDPRFTMAGGTINLLGRTAQIDGGTLQYDGGSIVGPGTLLIGNNTVFGGSVPFTNTATLDFYNNNVVNVDIVNEGTITRNRTPAGTVTFNGTVENAVGALFNARSSNPTTNFIFNNGLTNHGNLTLVNGDLRVEVNNGPLVNDGTINVNGDQLKTLACSSVQNNGTIRQTQGQLHVRQSGGAGDWFTNPGELVVDGGACTLYVPSGRLAVNEIGGVFRASGGPLRVENNGACRNDGDWIVDSAGTITIAGSAPTNYNPVDRSMTGGRIHIEAPGQFCFTDPIAVLRNATLECVHEPTLVCSSGGHTNPFGSIAVLEDEAELIFDDMNATVSGGLVVTDSHLTVRNGATFAVNGDLDVTGTATFVNGAVLLANGTLRSQGTIVIHDSTVIPQSVVIGRGQFVGDNSDIHGNIVNNGGTVKPGQSPGRFDALMDYTQDPNAALEIEIAGTTVESGYDLLAVGQTATLGGALNVVLLDGFVPSGGDAFEFLTAAAVVGQFDTTSLPTLPGGLCWNVEYLSDRVRLVVQSPPSVTQPPQSQTACEGSAVALFVVADGNPPPTFQWRKDGADIPGATLDMLHIDPVRAADAGSYDVVLTNDCGQAPSAPAILDVTVLPGDLDHDGGVTLVDLAVVLQNYGTPSGAGPDDGDLNGDGAVNLEDLAQLLAAYGTTCS